MTYYDIYFAVTGSKKDVDSFVKDVDVNNILDQENFRNIVNKHYVIEEDYFDWMNLEEDEDGKGNVGYQTDYESISVVNWQYSTSDCNSWDGLEELSLIFPNLNFITGFTTDGSCTYYNHFKNGRLVSSRDYEHPLQCLELVLLDASSIVPYSAKDELMRACLEDDEIGEIIHNSQKDVMEYLLDEDSACFDNFHMKANDVLLLNTLFYRFDDVFFKNLPKKLLKKVTKIKKLAAKLIEHQDDFEAIDPQAWHENEEQEVKPATSEEVDELIHSHINQRCDELVDHLRQQEFFLPEYSDDERQVCEWWLVSDWFLWKLKQSNYQIGLGFEYLGLHIWGRFSTGISLKDDGYIKQMAI